MAFSPKFFNTNKMFLRKKNSWYSKNVSYRRNSLLASTTAHKGFCASVGFGRNEMMLRYYFLGAFSKTSHSILCNVHSIKLFLNFTQSLMMFVVLRDWSICLKPFALVQKTKRAIAISGQKNSSKRENNLFPCAVKTRIRQLRLCEKAEPYPPFL